MKKIKKHQNNFMCGVCKDSGKKVRATYHEDGGFRYTMCDKHRWKIPDVVETYLTEAEYQTWDKL